MAGEHDARVVPHGHLARDRRADDGRPGHLRAHLLGYLFGEHVGQNAQIAGVVGLHPLGDGDHVLAGHEQARELLARPSYAEGVDPAEHDLRAVEGLRGLLELVGRHGRR